MTDAVLKERAHRLIDHMSSGQLTAVVGLLRVLVDPHDIAAPEDELISASENQRAAADDGSTTSHDDMLAEFGLNLEDILQDKSPAREIVSRS
jgi:hypothetical protein